MTSTDAEAVPAKRWKAWLLMVFLYLVAVPLSIWAIWGVQNALVAFVFLPALLAYLAMSVTRASMDAWADRAASPAPWYIRAVWRLTSPEDAAPRLPRPAFDRAMTVAMAVGPVAYAACYLVPLASDGKWLKAAVVAAWVIVALVFMVMILRRKPKSVMPATAA